MNAYQSLADDYYVNMNLSTEMELPSNRETVLHFFEQLQKSYPEMHAFTPETNGTLFWKRIKIVGIIAGVLSNPVVSRLGM